MEASLPTSPSAPWRWRRLVEVGSWLAVLTVNTVFNGMVATADNRGREHPAAAVEPWVWEISSAIGVALLVPLGVRAARRWPFRLAEACPPIGVHLGLSVPFSLAHVLIMVGLRKAAYAAAGTSYDFGSWLTQWPYEYLKDVRTWFLIVGVVCLYDFVQRRRQGEASLLAPPDDGPPVEPVDRPDRFLVRKLGKEFLINAREVERVQASGNYVNLLVRGHEYPMRATLSGFEQRLDPQRFVRVHRSYVVNLDYVSSIEPEDGGDALVRLASGATVPCSRRYRDVLRRHAGLDG
ncbi:LytTR family DNA-binding domain-containing protein [Luteibacter sp. PPL201]|uniref:LytTR family DNA-binding domain-containing protein n=1 Tax=Luteibacter sahnii TaxID=3021977 RepID=A0ABT6BD70_9GAMM|nr:LytTR family DNA-binding domain-containing protein [Luteibacter sp. PPL193]MDY1549357.1 LytTR family DNA-binding domain-containing protein [Luteibacter sp. PPL193]